MAYAHPAYHGGKNHPEQVREQDILEGMDDVIFVWNLKS